MSKNNGQVMVQSASKHLWLFARTCTPCSMSRRCVVKSSRLRKSKQLKKPRDLKLSLKQCNPKSGRRLLLLLLLELPSIKKLKLRIHLMKQSEE